MRRLIRDVYANVRLPGEARAMRRRDRAGLPPEPPDAAAAVDEAIRWLCRAQDRSASRDGGVARHYSLIDGWGPSYPETTGYIVPTFLDYARLTGDRGLRERARRMLDWLVSIQHPEGGFLGGTVSAASPEPVTFNTGQILLGLAAGVREFGDVYRPAMRAAADWLVATQDPDGAWRSHPTPFAAPGEKTYETHVAWGLLEAARVEPDRRYAEAALANIHWALGRQRENGWLADCCLTDPVRPLTHTLGYALRGIVEGYLFTGDDDLLAACRKTADGLLGALRRDGFLPGRLDREWRAAASWACLTGSVQIAHCWLLLHRATGEARYLGAAVAANRYVRRTVWLDGPPEVRGAVKGSFPVDGAYCTFQYPNWASKFFIDAHLLERAATEEGRGVSVPAGSD